MVVISIFYLVACLLVFAGLMGAERNLLRALVCVGVAQMVTTIATFLVALRLFLSLH
jgi:hypothetical protein